MGAAGWGIADSTFQWGYGVLCLLVLAALWLRRRRLLAAGDGDGSQGDVDAYGLAMLNGGPQLVITVAATRLHNRGSLVRSAGAGAMIAGRPPASAAASELEHEVYDAVRRDPGIAPRGLRAELESNEALRRIAASLVERGLLLDEATRTRVNLLWLWTLPVLALGAARVLSTAGREATGGYLVVVVALFACATLRFATLRPRATEHGRRLLERERAGRRARDRIPLADEVPWTVALYGAGALWAADPAMASAWSVPRDRGSTRGPYGGTCGAGYGGGHDSAGGGHSCGGGGCGGGSG